LQISDAKAQAQTESARSAVAAFKALGGGWQATELQTSAIKQPITIATSEKAE